MVYCYRISRSVLSSSGTIIIHFGTISDLFHMSNYLLTIGTIDRTDQFPDFYHSINNYSLLHLLLYAGNS
ncbi:unnamed protein product [Onchocerca flexuosa]|uniref:Ovule protein n=1 Tax=Onchocerca flexuosa TaxID=387005 RepID=A0A183HR88_9BILA|nr:unnamed protein product [Onchocerca flexuosa]